MVSGAPLLYLCLKPIKHEKWETNKNQATKGSRKKEGLESTFTCKWMRGRNEFHSMKEMICFNSEKCARNELPSLKTNFLFQFWNRIGISFSSGKKKTRLDITLSFKSNKSSNSFLSMFIVIEPLFF